MPQEAEVISKSTEDAEETVVHRNEQDQELEVLIEASRAAELALRSAEKAVQAAESNRRRLRDGEIIESSMVVRQQPAAAKAKTVNGTRNLEKVQTELEPSPKRAAVTVAPSKIGIVFLQTYRICGRFVVLTVNSGLQKKEDEPRYFQHFAAEQKPLKVNEEGHLLDVYSHNTSCTVTIEINGMEELREMEDLREVVGASVDESIFNDAIRKEELWAHVCHSRLQIADGIWDPA